MGIRGNSFWRSESQVFEGKPNKLKEEKNKETALCRTH